jgi:hypothetical protein
MTGPQVDGPGEPGDARDPIEIVADALVKFEILELTWEEVATLTLKALNEAGWQVAQLEQVGWYCNQAHGHGERTQLCVHGWPCGPTYVVSTPPHRSES